MPIKQVSVFLDNSPGTLSRFTSLIANNGINMIALTIADTTSFGILRCLVNDPVEAMRIISDAGYSVRLADVIAAVVPDKPGGLSGVLSLLAKHGVSIEYCYSFAYGFHGSFNGEEMRGAALVLQADDIDKAEGILARNRVAMLELDKFASLGA